MTKDWYVVQEEIKRLSFVQKKPLEEVKELMERKYKFRASTRAYRMKLKDWGLMRHKPRKVGRDRNETKETRQLCFQIDDDRDRESSATIEPVPTGTPPTQSCERNGGWKVVANADVVAEPTFIGMLGRPRDLQPTLDASPQAPDRTPQIVLDMLGAVLDQDSQVLERLIIENVNHINDPIGLPFDPPNGRFFGHSAMDQMVVLQHPGQTVLDIACGMPCGPCIWVLLSHGAKASRHPLGTDLALHNAIKNGRPYTVQALLVPGRSNVNGVPGTTWKPLLQAVFWNVPEVVRILLNRGANVDDAGPSPIGTGTHTALQLCLQHRHINYMDPVRKKRGNKIMKMLLDAGADIHVAPTDVSIQPTFEMFIKPWQSYPYWATGLSAEELDCIRLFVNKGANLQVPFDGYPCGSTWSKTFEHQMLWHSTPSIARLLIDSFLLSLSSNGSGLLHEVLGFCPDAKRHPADTLRDIHVLLQRGANPNMADINGLTPLRKCIEQCPAVDLIARLHMLLDGGADPEAEDSDGVQPYVLAARTFEEPLLSEVMQLLVSKIRGRHVRHVDGVSYTWAEAHFPISESQTYEQVMSCSRQTGDFMLNMRSMVPEDVQPAFQRAYFSVVSNNFLDTMTKVTRMKMLDDREKNEIVWIISMRKGVDLPEYRFDQGFVVALLDPQPIPSMMLEESAGMTTASVVFPESITSTGSSPASSITATANSISPPAHGPFQFNHNNSATSDQLSANSKSPAQTDSVVDDFFITPTTQIRWSNPWAKPKPGDLDKAVAAVLQYECDVCTGGNLLTKKELERHGVEHAHSEKCEEVECVRRFCTEKRRKEKDVGCQDYLFVEGM